MKFGTNYSMRTFGAIVLVILLEGRECCEVGGNEVNTEGEGLYTVGNWSCRQCQIVLPAQVFYKQHKQLSIGIRQQL